MVPRVSLWPTGLSAGVCSGMRGTRACGDVACCRAEAVRVVSIKAVGNREAEYAGQDEAAVGGSGGADSGG